MSDRTASRGTRSSELEEVPGSISATPANKMSWRAFSTTCFFVKKISGRGQHVDEVATDKSRGTITANQIDVDESTVARKRDAGVTRVEQVEAFVVGRIVRNKRSSVM